MVFPRARDVVSGQLVGVGAADVLVAGFPCTDVSALSPRSRTKEHKAKAVGAQGLCLLPSCSSSIRILVCVQCFWRTCSVWQLPLLESSNLAVALGRLSEAGFVCKAWHLLPHYVRCPAAAVQGLDCRFAAAGPRIRRSSSSRVHRFEAEPHASFGGACDDTAGQFLVA